MKTAWTGRYFDGKTAASRAVSIELTMSGLEIRTSAGLRMYWPFSEIRQTPGFPTREGVRFERGEEVPEILVVADPGFLGALNQLTPAQQGHFHQPVSGGRQVALTAAAGLAGLAILLALFFWFTPLVAALAAPRLPVAWEEALGRSAIDELVPVASHCVDPERIQRIEEIVAALAVAAPTSPYTFRVSVADTSAVNAVAAPGGFIVVFRGLLERTQSAEELAGILAHEMQHTLQRHGSRALLHQASTGLLLRAVVGDPSGGAALGLETARTLGALRYSREQEDEADTEGMRMLLAAGIDPRGMVDALEGLAAEDASRPASFSYLSTHPDPRERIVKLKAMAQQSQRVPSKLLPGYEWSDIWGICHQASI